MGMKLSDIDYDYSKVRKDADAKLAKVSKKTDIEALKKPDAATVHKMRVNQSVIRQIMDGCLDDYMEGECTFKETIEYIVEALEALDEK